MWHNVCHSLPVSTGEKKKMREEMVQNGVKFLQHPNVQVIKTIL
jgi:hypothetical protein